MDLTPVDPLAENTCEHQMPGKYPCGAPAVVCDLDSPTDPDERESGRPGFLCAHHARRAELDSELQAVGATVIQVKDLGAALEAMEAGGAALESIGLDLSGGLPDGLEWLTDSPSGTELAVTRAAHLARLALGDAS